MADAVVPLQRPMWWRVADRGLDDLEAVALVMCLEIEVRCSVASDVWDTLRPVVSDPVTALSVADGAPHMAALLVEQPVQWVIILTTKDY